MKYMELIAPCHFGMEAVLKREILDLGYEISKAECCVLFPGGRTGAAGEIKECAYDQSENRP